MTRRGRAAAVMFAVGLALALPHTADAGIFQQLADQLHARVAAAIAGAALRPPVPVVVHWKARRIGTLDLGSPLVALAAADLDGDGKGELYAVTAREVIAISLGGPGSGAGGKPHELGRVAFVGDPPAAVSRDVVGSATRDGKSIVAAVSGYARRLRVHWRGGTLVGDPGAPGFELCTHETATLSPGKNFFGDGPSAIYAMHCHDDLVDPTGHPLAVRGTVSTTGKLEVTVGAAHYELSGVGVAFELADLDRDGRPEAIVSAAGAPGDSDAVKVVTLGGDDKKPMYKHAFAGGIAGLVAIDGDGDGVLEVIAAVRLAGATRVDLWRLD
jgi:hypothetical protein